MFRCLLVSLASLGIAELGFKQPFQELVNPHQPPGRITGVSKRSLVNQKLLSGCGSNRNSLGPHAGFGPFVLLPIACLGGPFLTCQVCFHPLGFDLEALDISRQCTGLVHHAPSGKPDAC